MTFDFPAPSDLPEGARLVVPDPSRPILTMSNRFRWSKCALSAVLPRIRTQSGPAAQEGTEAHKVAEARVLDAFAPSTQRSTVPVQPPAGLEGFDYSAEGVARWVAQVDAHADQYAAHAQSLFSDCATASSAVPEFRFTAHIHGVELRTVADVMLWNGAARRLVVGDYKYGGSPVGCGTLDEPNEQVAGALAVLTSDWLGTDKIDPTHAGAFVYQPRIRFGEPFQVLAPLTPEWLATERAKLDAEVHAVARAASSPGGTPPAPGEHCKYCPSARWCPAASEYGTAALDVESGRRAVVDLSPEEVMHLWGARSAFKQFEDDLRERVKMLAEAGDPVVKTTRRKGAEMWVDPGVVIEQLLIHERYDLLVPPSIGKMRETAIPTEAITAAIGRAPDVLIHSPAGGKNLSGARDAFAKYLGKAENN
ncbi:exonuclease [Xanthomonas phage NEB7]|nr:exonuclease [Xanthomonas phage NEB7]